jgi:DNA-binding Lrp family transcriptional regulator
VYKLDDLDRQILEILQENGRASHVNIAKQLGVGHTRVRDRILRMEEAGVIKGYRAVIDPAVLGYGIHCIVLYKADQQLDFDELAEKILEIDEVVDVANVTGDFDAHIQVWARDVPHLRDILYYKLSVLPGFINTNSSIVLKHWWKPWGFNN